MSLDQLIQTDSEPTPEQRAAAQIDTALGKLQHSAAAAVRALDDRRLYHDAETLRAALWPDATAEEIEARAALEPLLRSWGEPALIVADAEALATAETLIASRREVANAVGPVIGVLGAVRRTGQRGGVVPERLAALAPLVEPLLTHSVRDLDADAATVREGIGRVLQAGVAINVQAVAIGKRLGWSHVSPLLSLGQWWTELRAVIVEHLPEVDPGEPQANPDPDDGSA